MLVGEITGGGRVGFVWHGLVGFVWYDCGGFVRSSAVGFHFLAETDVGEFPVEFFDGDDVFRL